DISSGVDTAEPFTIRGEKRRTRASADEPTTERSADIEKGWGDGASLHGLVDVTAHISSPDAFAKGLYATIIDDLGPQMHRPDRRTIEGAGLAQHQQTKRQGEDFSRHTQVQVRFPDGFLFSMRHIAWGENAQDAKRKEDDLKLNVPNKSQNEKSNVVSIA
ncbi:unnamed protein product, partial [Fusarium graminearum]